MKIVTGWGRCGEHEGPMELEKTKKKPFRKLQSRERVLNVIAVSPFFCAGGTIGFNSKRCALRRETQPIHHREV